MVAVKQMIKIIRKVDIEKQYEQILRIELDYWLASLHQAMTDKDESYKSNCIKRLKEIHGELEGLQAYA